MSKPWYRDREWWRDHWTDAVELACTVGLVGWTATAWREAGELAAMHPSTFALCCIASFMLGVACTRTVIVILEARTERANLDMLRGLPPHILSMVKQAYEYGYVSESYYDTRVQYLLDLKVLAAPPLIRAIGPTEFIIRPTCRSFIRKHERELFG